MASSPASAAELEHGHDTKLDQVYEVVSELLADGFNPIVFCRFIDTASTSPSTSNGGSAAATPSPPSPALCRRTNAWPESAS